MKAGLQPDRVHALRAFLDGPAIVPSLGEVRLDEATLAENLVFGFDTRDERARAFVLLRSQLLKHAVPSGGRVIAITSTRASDGKTCVAVNLAAALSKIHPTILIDLDLRRPSVGTRLGVTHHRGVDDFLGGSATWAETGVRIEGSELTVHCAREPQPHSSELLASPRLAEMFDGIRAAPGAPICLVDTPPAMLLDDIMLIARAVDGILMVAEEGRTRRNDLTAALELLSPTPIVGSVLNRSLYSNRTSYNYDYY